MFLETLELYLNITMLQCLLHENFCISIFEAILSLTVSHVDLIRVRETYRKVILEPFNEQIDYQGLKLKEFVVQVYPKEIEVISLVEDKAP